MNIQLNLATKKDFNELAKIYSEEFSKTPYNEPWTLEKALKKLDIFSKYCDIWNILYENKSVGFIIINPNQWCPGEIAFGEEIAIKSEFQNKGIGTKTFEMIFEKYKKRGFKRFMGMENKSSKAKSLYNKIGVKESETYVIIEKELN